MMLVLRWLAVLGVAVILGGSCSINHRSGDFTCETQADCISGRVCSDGLCVATKLDSGVKTDAPSAGCPAQCTSCNTTTKSCTIDCALNNGACNQAITCPTGWDCNIACSTGSSCRNGINCLTSKSCTIACSGALSCKAISCGTGRCNVDCTGNSSCRDVSCGLSCACDVTCHANSLCTNLTCRVSPDCISTMQFGGCTSLTPGCNTCM
jgi:hypothetical protein